MSTIEGKKTSWPFENLRTQIFLEKVGVQNHDKSLFIGGGVSIDKEVYLHSL